MCLGWRGTAGQPIARGRPTGDWQAVNHHTGQKCQSEEQQYCPLPRAGNGRIKVHGGTDADVTHYEREQ